MIAASSHPVRGGRFLRRGVASAGSLPALTAAAVLLVVATLSASASAWGQPVTTEPSRPGVVPALVATVTPDPLDPPSIQVAGIWVSGDPTAAAQGVAPVIVAFATAFEVPRQPWRVAVSVGDPEGQRVRSSLVSVGSAGVSGRVERGDGVQWDDAGPAEVTATTDGQVSVGVPVGDAAEDAVLWVEAEATVDGSIELSRTPTFALADLLGERPGPSLGTSPFASDPAEPDATPVAVGAPGPTVQVVGRSLEVTTVAATPEQIDGSGVVDAIDTVTITRSDPEPTTSRVEIDRRTGEVRLATAGAEAFVAVPGVTPWLVNAPSGTAPGAPATVTFDLEALNQAVGGPAFDRTTTRVGVARTLALDDRRILDAAGVAGTMAWFDESLTTPAATEPAAGTSEGVPTLLWVLVGAVMAGAVVVLVVLVARRWAGREPRPIERLDALPASVAAGVGALPVASVPESPGPPPPEPTEPPPPEPTEPPPPQPEQQEVDPLATFLAEVDELSARVDRLGRPGDAGSAPTIPPDEGDDRPR